jgi:tryptophan-rich sensory protein
MKSRWLPLGFFLFLAFLAGAIGAFATSTSVHTWYPSLHKPAWTPPSWLFAPVWTLLYIAMGVAAWRVWRTLEALESRRLVRLYAAQLALNAIWSILFFGQQSPGLALIEVIVLWLVLVRMLALLWPVDRAAGVLWALYVAWVTFATLLNAAVWELNR